MNHRNISIKLFTTVSALASIAIISGCSGGSSSISSTGGGSASGVGDIAITSIQGTNTSAINSSNSDGSGYFFTSSANLSIVGTCARGVNKIVASIARDSGGTGAPVGAVTSTEEATCANDGSFTWSKSSMLGGSAVAPPLGTGLQYTVTLSSQASDGSTLDSEPVKINIDNVAPAVPTINTTYYVTIGGGTCGITNPYACTSTDDSALLSIYVDIATDAVGLTSSRGTSTFSSGQTYIVSETLPGNGVSVPYTMTTQDKAGNISILPISVTFNTTLAPPVLNIGGGSTFNGGLIGYAPDGNLGSIGVFGPTSVASPLTSFLTDLGALAN